LDASRVSEDADTAFYQENLETQYKYQPDKQETAIKTVLEQAEELYGEWVA
jgi:hypothetical protein